MGRPHRALAGVAFGALIAAQSPQPPGIDDGRQWIDTKGRIAAGSPAILRAAVATAFNDVATAERLLHDVIRTQPRSEPASQAHLLLSRIYLRRGQYVRLFDNLDAWTAAFPDRKEVREEHKDIGLFRGLPDQINGPREPAILPHEKDEFSAPISINGTPATYLLDTGAWISVITEAEAVRLGLEIRTGTGTIGDASGTGVKVRTAIAKELTVGPMRFRDVSFVVIPSQDLGGILGIPVLLALERIRWSNDGKWELGGPTDRNDSDAPNLVFFENHLLLAARVSRARVFGAFDTGAVSTDLNSNFADQFAELIKAKGTRGTREMTGLGGTVSVDSIRLSDLTFDIGGKPVTLRPAHVTLQRTAAMGGTCCIGNIGRDVLLATGRFALDLGTMTLKLH